MEEACTNIILHAYKGRAGLIRVSVRVENELSRIMIEDDGPPFDPTKHTTLHRVTQDGSERPVGGWGIGLIGALMGEITYERRHEKNILCLEKKRRDED